MSEEKLLVKMLKCIKPRLNDDICMIFEHRHDQIYQFILSLKKKPIPYIVFHFYA